MVGKSTCFRRLCGGLYWSSGSCRTGSRMEITQFISMKVLSYVPYDKQSRILVRARDWVGITVRSTASRPYMPDRCQRYGRGRVDVNVSNQRGWDYGATYRVRFHRHLRMRQASNANRVRPRRSVGWEGGLFRRRHDEDHYVQRKFQ